MKLSAMPSKVLLSQVSEYVYTSFEPNDFCNIETLGLGYDLDQTHVWTLNFGIIPSVPPQEYRDRILK
jgi:hypothetical protein